MDPVVYAMIVAGRPDHNWRIVSYPYVTKAAVEGDKTGVYIPIQTLCDWRRKVYGNEGSEAKNRSTQVSVDQCRGKSGDI